jgi:phosphatidylglycerophosphate synthase
LARLLASIVLFVLLAMMPAPDAPSRKTLAVVSLWLFVAIAVSDWLNGWCARRFGMVTAIGRILDPFVDKITVRGTFILCSVFPERLLPSRLGWRSRSSVASSS